MILGKSIAETMFGLVADGKKGTYKK